jgi:hypothetical protein
MAKGIRSKSKRQNRSVLRANLSHPQIKKRQEEIATALQQSLDEKNGTTVKGLKGLFPGTGLAVAFSQERALENEAVEKVELKKTLKENAKPKVVKGSRARVNLTKKLSWF